MMHNKLGRLTCALLLALNAGLASAAYQLNFQPPVTRVASEIYELHLLMMYVILVIFCVVFGVMFYSIYAHRKSVGHTAKQFHENTTVEIIWTVIPFVILIGLAWPATKTLIAFKDTSNPDMDYGEPIPTRPLIDPPLRRMDQRAFRLSELKGRWILLQLDEADCAAACRGKLYNMRQARLAQGREMERIERVWLILDEAPLETQLMREYDGTRMLRAAGSPLLAEFPPAGGVRDHIYVIDPLGNLMLRFPKNVDPYKMDKDLARLLKVSRIG
jgi:Cytochrome C oxidase subunit II, transmembrane domain